MVVWPSNSYFALGRILGQLFEIRTGAWIFTVGNFLALATIPISKVLYFLKVFPWKGIRYKVTNRRVIVERGWTGEEERSVDLGRFDRIEIVVRPGQGWYNSGDLIFRQGQTATFQLDGVSRPESFRQICLKTRQANVTVKQARDKEAREEQGAAV